MCGQVHEQTGQLFRGKADMGVVGAGMQATVAAVEQAGIVLQDLEQQDRLAPLADGRGNEASQWIRLTAPQPAGGIGLHLSRFGQDVQLLNRVHTTRRPAIQRLLVRLPALYEH